MKKLYTILSSILFRVFYIKPIIKFLNKYKVFFIISSGALLFFFMEWFKTFDLKEIIEYKKNILAIAQDHPFMFSLIFFLICFFLAMLSIPGTTVVNVTGGFLFGLVKGTMISVFAISLGSCVTFLFTRHFLKGFFIKKDKEKLKKIYNILEKDSVYYLFALRMFPFTPLFFTNIAMGLSSIKLSIFYMVSFIALLPSLSIYANIGSQLSQLEGLQGFVAPNLLFSFGLIGVFPLFVKYLFLFLKKFKKSKENLPLESDSLLFG